MCQGIGQLHDTKILDFAPAGLTNPAELGLDLSTPALRAAQVSSPSNTTKIQVSCDDAIALVKASGIR
jgi:hypothetical protein